MAERAPENPITLIHGGGGGDKAYLTCVTWKCNTERIMVICQWKTRRERAHWQYIPSCEEQTQRGKSVPALGWTTCSIFPPVIISRNPSQRASTGDAPELITLGSRPWAFWTGPEAIRTLARLYGHRSGPHTKGDKDDPLFWEIPWMCAIIHPSTDLDLWGIKRELIKEPCILQTRHRTVQMLLPAPCLNDIFCFS